MAGTTMLIIEDDTIQREMMASVLRRQGFTVDTARDGSEAMNRLSNGSLPDLILLDMLLPTVDRDGWWFLKQRQRTPAFASIPVVITTALSVASKEWASSLGADGLVRKPFDEAVLLAEVHRHLGVTAHR